MVKLWMSIKSSTGIVLSETFVNTGLALVTYAVIVRLTNIETVGLWALVSSLLAFARCVDVWSRGVSTFVAQARSSEGENRAATYVTTAALSGALGYAIITIVAGPLVYWGLKPTLDHDDERALIEILPLMLFSFWINSVGAIYQLGFLGFERPKLKAIQTIVGSVLFLAFTILLAPTYGLLGMVIAQVIQGGAMILYGLPAFHIVMMGRQKIRLYDQKIVGQLASFGSKAISLGAMQLLTEPILRLLAYSFGGLASVGLVDFASRLCMIPRTFIGSIGQNIVPAFSRAAYGADDNKQQLFRHFRSIIIPLGVGMMASMIGISYLAGLLIIQEKSVDVAVVTTILGIGWLSNMLVSTEYFMLFGYRKLRLLIVSHVVMIVGMLGLGFIGGMLSTLVGALTGAMLGVTLSSLILFLFARGTGRTHCCWKSIILDKSFVLALVTIFILSVQLYVIVWGTISNDLAASVGTILTGLFIVILTPWSKLMAVTKSIDAVASVKIEERVHPYE